MEVWSRSGKAASKNGFSLLARLESEAVRGGHTAASLVDRCRSTFGSLPGMRDLVQQFGDGEGVALAGVVNAVVQLLQAHQLREARGRGKLPSLAPEDGFAAGGTIEGGFARHSQEWVGSPSTFKELTYSSTVNLTLHNEQEVPQDPFADAGGGGGGGVRGRGGAARPGTPTVPPPRPPPPLRAPVLLPPAPPPKHGAADPEAAHRATHQGRAPRPLGVEARVATLRALRSERVQLLALGAGHADASGGGGGGDEKGGEDVPSVVPVPAEPRGAAARGVPNMAAIRAAVGRGGVSFATRRQLSLQLRLREVVGAIRQLADDGVDGPDDYAAEDPPEYMAAEGKGGGGDGGGGAGAGGGGGGRGGLLGWIIHWEREERSAETAQLARRAAAQQEELWGRLLARAGKQHGPLAPPPVLAHHTRGFRLASGGRTVPGGEAEAAVKEVNYRAIFRIVMKGEARYRDWGKAEWAEHRAAAMAAHRAAREAAAWAGARQADAAAAAAAAARGAAGKAAARRRALAAEGRSRAPALSASVAGSPIASKRRQQRAAARAAATAAGAAPDAKSAARDAIDEAQRLFERALALAAAPFAAAEAPPAPFVPAGVGQLGGGGQAPLHPDEALAALLEAAGAAPAKPEGWTAKELQDAMLARYDFGAGGSVLPPLAERRPPRPRGGGGGSEGPRSPGASFPSKSRFDDALATMLDFGRLRRCVNGALLDAGDMLVRRAKGGTDTTGQAPARRHRYFWADTPSGQAVKNPIASETGWQGLVYSNFGMSFSRTANRHIINHQDVPLYDAASDKHCPWARTGSFRKRAEKQRRQAERAERKRTAAWRKKQEAMAAIEAGYAHVKLKAMAQALALSRPLARRAARCGGVSVLVTLFYIAPEPANDADFGGEGGRRGRRGRRGEGGGGGEEAGGEDGGDGAAVGTLQFVGVPLDGRGDCTRERRVLVLDARRPCLWLAEDAPEEAPGSAEWEAQCRELLRRPLALHAPPMSLGALPLPREAPTAAGLRAAAAAAAGDGGDGDGGGGGGGGPAVASAPNFGGRRPSQADLFAAVDAAPLPPSPLSLESLAAEEARLEQEDWHAAARSIQKHHRRRDAAKTVGAKRDALAAAEREREMLLLVELEEAARRREEAAEAGRRAARREAVAALCGMWEGVDEDGKKLSAVKLSFTLRSEDGPETDIKGEGQSQWHMMTKAFELSGFLQLDSGELSLEKAQLKVRVAYSGELRDDDFSGQKRITATCMGGGELSLTRTR